ncbi:FAD-dependent oxidoreductase [Marinospirillum sp. MEB164]|uniref:FAD-dependent oxidoreductase n=1 Tax=Marinospirillum alkalitolerans TaxID=3123374 RepID=A0ABW8PW21_9GAMM
MSHTTPSSAPWILVGSGMAGYQLAREIRAQEAQLGLPAQQLIMITSDGGEVYSKPLLSTALSKAILPERLISATGEQAAAELALELRPWTRVEQLRPDQQQLILSTGEELSYGRLFLALGAAPQGPFVGLKGVHCLNSWQEYQAFHQQLQALSTQQVVILGSGLVGVEMAQDLLQAGYRVTLITRAPHLLDGLLPAEAAAFLEAALIEQGLTIQRATEVVAITPKATGQQLVLSDGRQQDAELIISALGLAPRITLAAEAGLATSRRGIAVNRQLQTSDPNIYALGDCADLDGQLLMYVQPLMASARSLAQQLFQPEAPGLSLPALPVLIKTPTCPCVVAPPQGEGHWEIEANPQGVTGRFISPEGALLGFALVGQAVRQKSTLTRQLPDLLPEPPAPHERVMPSLSDR